MENREEEARREGVESGEEVRSREEKSGPSPGFHRGWIAGGVGAGLVLVLATAALSRDWSRDLGVTLMGLGLLLVALALVTQWRWLAGQMLLKVIFLALGGGTVLLGGGALLQLVGPEPTCPVYEAILEVPAGVIPRATHALRPVGSTEPFIPAEWDVDCGTLWPSGAPTLTGGPDEELVGVVLLSGADRRRLRPERTTPPSSNLELADLRAKTVEACLRKGNPPAVGAEIPFHVYTRAPSIEASGLGDDDYAPDRTVQVYGVWEPRRHREAQSVRLVLTPRPGNPGSREPGPAAARRATAEAVGHGTEKGTGAHAAAYPPVSSGR